MQDVGPGDKNRPPSDVDKPTKDSSASVEPIVAAVGPSEPTASPNLREEFEQNLHRVKSALRRMPQC